MQETKAYTEAFRAPDAHILIVDDTRMNLTVAANLLKKTDIEIDMAISGAEAITLARTIRYDLILMDQRMPEMDGTEAMRRIRADESGVNRDTQFICLTADAVSGAREHYLAAGFTDYLTKPIDGYALEMMLMKYLPEDKIQRAREEEPEQVEADAGGCLNDALDGLNAAGIDTQAGLYYCQDDRELYVSLLLEFAKGAQEKADRLQEFFKLRDWSNYAVLAHALKSSSRMIGAAALSEAAAKLETAADEGRTQDVTRGHEETLESYRAAARAILQTLEPPPEYEVLEFLPEDN